MELGAARLGSLQEHLLAVRAAVSRNGDGQSAAGVTSGEVHVDGCNLGQQSFWLPAIPLRVLDLQLTPLWPCSPTTYAYQTVISLHQLIEHRLGLILHCTGVAAVAV